MMTRDSEIKDLNLFRLREIIKLAKKRKPTINSIAHLIAMRRLIEKAIDQQIDCLHRIAVKKNPIKPAF